MNCPHARRKLFGLLAASGLALAAGACRSASPRAGSGAADVCGAAGFARTADDHLLVYVDQPFEVPSVAGVITGPGGSWSDITLVAFEIQPLRGSGGVRRVRADNQGSFRIPDLRSGTYCFKASSAGTKPVVGVVTVTKRARAGDLIRVELAGR